MAFFPPSVRPQPASRERSRLCTRRFLADGALRKKAKWLIVIGLALLLPLVLRLMAAQDLSSFFVVTGIAGAVSLVTALVAYVAAMH